MKTSGWRQVRRMMLWSVTHKKQQYMALQGTLYSDCSRTNDSLPCNCHQVLWVQVSISSSPSGSVGDAYYVCGEESKKQHTLEVWDRGDCSSTGPQKLWHLSGWPWAIGMPRKHVTTCREALSICISIKGWPLPLLAPVLSVTNFWPVSCEASLPPAGHQALDGKQ